MITNGPTGAYRISCSGHATTVNQSSFLTGHATATNQSSFMKSHAKPVLSRAWSAPPINPFMTSSPLFREEDIAEERSRLLKSHLARQTKVEVKAGEKMLGTKAVRHAMMKDVYDLCIKVGATVPDEVADYFDDEEPGDAIEWRFLTSDPAVEYYTDSYSNRCVLIDIDEMPTNCRYICVTLLD